MAIFFVIEKVRRDHPEQGNWHNELLKAHPSSERWRRMPIMWKSQWNHFPMKRQLDFIRKSGFNDHAYMLEKYFGQKNR